jgi:PAS domain S-box-containing protein
MAEPNKNGPQSGPGPRNWSWVNWTSYFLLAAGVALSVAFYSIARETEQQRQVVQFDQQADHQIYAVQSALDAQAALLNSLSSYVQASVDLDQEGFSAFAAPLLANCRGVQAVEWIPYVTREQRSEFETSARSEQFPEFVIKEMSPDRELVASTEKEEYFPVWLVHPVVGNSRAVGFDLGSEPSRRQALKRAVETSQSVATAPITLVQEEGNQKAYLLFQPVWAGSGEQRISRGLRGFVLGVFRAGDMITGALEPLTGRALPMEINDLDGGDSGLILRNHDENDEEEHLKRLVNLSVGGRRWQVTLLSHQHISRWAVVLPGVILVSGILLTVVSCLLLHTLARGRASAEKLILDRTRALSASEERLRTVADLSTDFVFWLQRDKTLKYVSPAAFPLTGYRVEEFIEQPGLMDAIIHPLDRKKWSEHWEHTLAGEPCSAMELRINNRQGETRWVRHQCRPILAEDGGMVGVRGNFSDITETRQHADRLERERRLFTGGPVVVFRWRAEEGWPVEYVSPNVDAIFGVEAEEWLEGRVRYMDFIHPEDLPRVKQEVEGYVALDESHFEQDYRIVDRFGNVLNLFDVTLIVRDADGNPTHFEGYVLDVTEREEARHELSVSRQRLDLALAGAGLGLWDWNVKSDSVVFDERWAAMLGYDLAELDDQLETWSKLVHPDDLPHVVKTLQEHMDGKTAQYESEHRLRHKDGHWIWVLDRGKVLHHDEDGQPLRAVGTHLDITARRRQEERQTGLIHLREKTTRDLAKCTSPGSIMNLANRFGEEFSRRAGGTCSFLLRLTEGEDRARLLQHWQDDPDPDLEQIFQQANVDAGAQWWRLTGDSSGVCLVDLDRTELSDHLSSYLQHLGARTLVLLTIPVATRRRYVLAIGVTEGVDQWLPHDTESFLAVRDSFAHAQQRVAFRQENESTRGLLVKALERAEQANKVKTSFLARMSHEIRTPLTAIAGLTDILGRHSRHLDTKEKAWLEKVRHNTDHLVALLNDLLDLSKIDAGELQITRGPVEIADVLTTVEATLQPRAQEKGIQLRIGCSPQVPVRFHSDRLRLRQILLNLAGNAVKFTDQGQVEVDADYSGVQGEKIGELVVTVRDTGTGIPADQLEAIFQPFQQASSVDLATRGGTGLGLDISRRLARALGGDITVVSQLGLGSAFTLTLPITGSQGVKAEAGAGALPDFEPPDPSDSYPDLAGCRILVVDDNPDNRQVITYYLEEVGIQPELAEDGAQGVKKAQTAAGGDAPFDLILMDMRMPVLNGYEATAKLRQLGLKLPIIALTAHAMDGDEQACINFGCNAYVSKPIEPDTLLATISRLLAPAGGHQEKAARKKSKPIPNRLPPDPRFAPLVLKYQRGLVEVREDLAAARSKADQDAVYNIAHKLHGTGANFGFPEISEAARDCEERLHHGDGLGEVDELDVLDELLLAAVAELTDEAEPAETK